MKLVSNFLFTGLLISVFSASVYAQEAEQTIPQILDTFKKGGVTAEQAYLNMLSVYENGEIHKCTTPLHMFAHKYKGEIPFSLLVKSESSRNKSSRPTYTSPSGKFVFTYETSGGDAVPSGDADASGIPDFVEWAAIAADSSYNHLVQTLGFTDPIPDGSTYDVSFEDMGFYGFAETIGGNGPGTRIVLENDFAGFPANDDPDGDQRGALRVTMAHEFKHAIQFAQNNFSGEADSWAEMDATLIEEVVYDVVNDYYNYLGGSGDVFGGPGTTVIPGSYEDITWALFFHEKYGADFWPAVWNRIESSGSSLDLLDAVDQELTSRSIVYTAALQELYAWHFVSGAYNNPNFGFDESLFYPTPNAQRTDTQVDDQFSADISLGRFSSYFLNVKPPASQTGDVSVLVDTENKDNISLAVVGLFKDGSVEFELATLESDFLVVNEGWNWADIDRIGAIVVNRNRSISRTFKIRVSDTFPTSIPIDNTLPTTTELKQNYPNPFNPSTVIPVSISETQRVTVDIYDITGRLVQSVFDGNLSSGNYELPVNLESLASGVYMYRLKTSDNVQIKRMTLIK